MKLSYFEDFFVLNSIGIFILLCKPGKTAQNAVKVAKNGILGTFDPPLSAEWGKGGQNQIFNFKPLFMFFLIGYFNFHTKL